MKEINTIESVEPCSGRYSLAKDVQLNSWLAVSVATYVLDLLLVRHHPAWRPLLKALVDLTPLVPGLFYLRGWMQFVRGLDELQRRIQLEAFLFAALGTVFVGIAVDVLNRHGFLPGFLPHGLGLGGAWFAMFDLYLVGGAIANRRFQ